MDCKEFKKLLDEYECLNSDKKQEMENHAATCKECAEEFENYKLITETLKNLPELKAPLDFLEKLNERIDKENIVPTPKLGVWGGLKKYGCRYGAAAACIALVMVIGVSNTELVDKMIGADGGEAIVSVSEITEPFKEAVPTASIMPTAAATEIPATAVPETAEGTKKPLATPIPNSTKAPKPTVTSTPKRTQSVPAVSYTSAPSVTEAPKPVATEVPEPIATTAPTAKPQETDNTDAQNEPREDAPTVALIDDEKDNTPVMNPDEYSLPEETPSTENKSRSSGGYAHGGSIQVSYANAERAKEIINAYSVGSNGDYYSVSADVVEEFIQAMNSVGASVDGGSIEMGADTITFQLVIS